MAIPTWFDAKDYLANKLAQLQATEPEANWNVYSMAQAFANAGYEGVDGAYQHFLDHGMAEDVSPNALFDVDAYYANKLEALQRDPKTAEEWNGKTVKDVKDAFAANGLSAWEHYQQFGTAEGINPSAEFDTVKYLEAKAAAMNALGGDKVWTAADVADAFAENGWSALEHYELFGKSGAEGEVSPDYDPAPVVTLTFAEALAADPLPAEYFLADGAASFENVSVADLEAGQVKAREIFDGALNKADLEYSVAYTLSDTLANIMDADPAVLDGHTYTLTDGAADFGTDLTVDAVVKAQADAQAFINGSANETKPALEATYTLSDTLQNLFDNKGIVDGHTYAVTDGTYTFAGDPMTVAEAAAAKADIDAFAKAGGVDLTFYQYALSDTLENLVAADVDFDMSVTSYTVTGHDFTIGNDKTIADIQDAQAMVTELLSSEKCTNGADVTPVYSYSVSDTLANIMDSTALVEGHYYTLLMNDTNVHLGELSVAASKNPGDSPAAEPVKTIIHGATNGEGFTPKYTFVLNDSVKAIGDEIKGGGLPDGTIGYILTDSVDNINGAEGSLLLGANYYVLNDTLGNIMNAAESVLANAHSYALDDANFTIADAASVEAAQKALAQAQDVIAHASNEGLKLNATFSLVDTVSNLQSNSELLHQATDYSIEDTASAIADAASVFVKDAENVTVKDTLAGIDEANKVLDLSEITHVDANVDNDTTISVATLSSLGGLIDKDKAALHVAEDATVAVTVDAANAETGATINLTQLTTGDAVKGTITFNAIGSDKADEITAHANGGVITGGGGADKITLDENSGAADTLVYKAVADSNGTNFDRVTNFTADEDKLDLSALNLTHKDLNDSALTTDFVTISGNDADTASFTVKGDKVAEFFGAGDQQKGVVFATDQVDGTDVTFVFIDADGDGKWDAGNDMAIQLTGITSIDVGDIDFDE